MDVLSSVGNFLVAFGGGVAGSVFTLLGVSPLEWLRRQGDRPLLTSNVALSGQHSAPSEHLGFYPVSYSKPFLATQLPTPPEMGHGELAT